MIFLWGGIIAGLSLAQQITSTDMGYTLTDLGTLGGPTSGGQCINNRGDFTGNSVSASGVVQAFIYTKGTMTGIGEGHSWGYGINDMGDRVVDYRIGGIGPMRAFLYSNGTMTQLGTLGGNYLRWPPGSGYFVFGKSLLPSIHRPPQASLWT